jgi:hypothetical protein
LGLIATTLTGPPCALKVDFKAKEARSQDITLPSEVPQNSESPSGLIAREMTSVISGAGNV